MSKIWASSDAAAEEAPQALTYKVEVYTGDVRGAGTHVRIAHMHSEMAHRHSCACFSVHACTSMLKLGDLMHPDYAKIVQRSSCRAVHMEPTSIQIKELSDVAGTSCGAVDRD